METDNDNNTRMPETTNNRSLTPLNGGMVLASLEKKFVAVKTAKDAVTLQAENPDAIRCLKRIVREDGEMKLKKTLAALLYALDKFLHLKEGLSDEEIFFTADSIVDEFGGQITFADIKVVIENAKRGNYGKMYERLSCATVMDWFRQYIDQRLDAAEQYSISQTRRKYGTPSVRVAPKRPQPSDDDAAYKDYRARVTSDLIKQAMEQNESL